MKKWVSGGFNKVVINFVGTNVFEQTRTHMHTRTRTKQYPPSIPLQMVSSGAKMSYERKLWSRQEVSFPYIVLCRSASGILMLSWRGCRAASLCKKHDLGPVALWEKGISCNKGIIVPPSCGSPLSESVMVGVGGKEVGSVLFSHH